MNKQTMKNILLREIKKKREKPALLSWSKQIVGLLSAKYEENKVKPHVSRSINKRDVNILKK